MNAKQLAFARAIHNTLWEFAELSDQERAGVQAFFAESHSAVGEAAVKAMREAQASLNKSHACLDHELSAIRSEVAP